ncbi:MFS transporter [Conexibacter stalactiti]|uniref:MFS transporter n=1 Tax=Conexibacter stalactiti TaxID=1940611 RepID=A0ABU4HQC5_9ACTN|nr:MFS transporter [Conexibacter stalactiti]MDW5595521.1 MFS transporter [Conexibacter stalactiti]MEC5036163.1 MFS transporter [Conexibacter stalactiti]
MVLRRPRVATAAMFFVSGSVIGTWAGSVPYVRDRLDVSTSMIGLCLLAMAAGSVLAMIVVGRELDRRSSATLTRLGALLVPLTGVLPLLAPSPAALALALFALGVANGVLDVSMNAHGVAVEHAQERPVMSSLHGGWSLGGLVGAGAVALGHVAGVDPRVEAAVFCALLLVGGLWFGRHLGDVSAATQGAGAAGGEGGASVGASGSDGAAPAQARFVWPSRAILLIGSLSAMLFLSEGAITDWSALYLDRDLGAAAAVAAVAYAGFAGGMAIGRFCGDALNHRIGPARLLRWGSAAASLALAATLLSGEPLLALPALALAGLGLANGVPLLFSAAGRSREMSPGPAIAAVSTMSYGGLLAGPPLLGFVADLTSLPWALSATVALTAVVALAAGRAER